MSSQIIKCLEERLSDQELAKAGDIIRSGGLVAFPTESFYGLGVDALNDKAIERLISVKKRQENNPILILIPSIECLGEYVKIVPGIAEKLMKRFWPGGLTIVLEAAPAVPSILTSGTGKIGIRLSSDPIATGLAKAVGRPVTGTSANISGHPPCNLARDVFDSIGNDIDLILDGGKTKGEKGSTVLDLTVTPPKVLREGIISLDLLKEEVGNVAK